MKRRIRIIVATAFALIATGAGQHAFAESTPKTPAPNSGAGTWACVVVEQTAGTCVDNPFAPFEKQGGVVGIVSNTIGINRPL
jgi:hypothetical protein